VKVQAISINTGFPNFPKKLPDIYDYRDGKKEVKRIAFWELIHIMIMDSSRIKYLIERRSGSIIFQRFYGYTQNKDQSSS
jgi:hypothetical protein